MKITAFGPDNLTQLRKDLENAIKTVCDNYGISAPTLGNCSYTPTCFTSQKLNFGVKQTVSDIDPEKLVGRRFKQGQRTFLIISNDGNGKVTGRTNRGASYTIRLDQLDSMIAL